jgi:hypothetical protein
MSDSEGEVRKDTTQTTAPKPKKVLSEKQRAGLHKGMEALKAKRVQLQAEKAEREEKKKKGEAVEEPVKIPKKDVKVLEPVVVVEPPAPKVRKERADKGKPRGAIKPPTITRAEFEALQQKIVEALPKEKVVEKVVEKPIERVVEKVVVTEKKVTGSEMLNKIFNLR